ncbi:MAG: hypothetical protein AAF411_09520 [Myxococcota bacterium]
MNAAHATSDRICPRCGEMVRGERLKEGTARTWLWRCICGWSQLVSESGVVDRNGIRGLLDEADEGELEGG